VLAGFWFRGSAVGLILGILASRVLAAIATKRLRDPLVLTGVGLTMALLGLG
jgi:hypothetical protein